jgi:hypothetical protein
MVSLVDPKPWIPLIGRLFVAFGGIERTTHECIREWAGETIHKHVAHSRLSDRLDLAADLAESRDVSESMKRDFKATVWKARDLAKHRNHVAHNPLCLVLLQDGIDSSFLEAITSNKDENKLMSLSELGRVVEAAELCSEELHQRFVAFRLATLDLESLHDPAIADVGAAWELEIERRMVEHDRGEINSIDADEVFAKARSIAR